MLPVPVGIAGAQSNILLFTRSWMRQGTLGSKVLIGFIGVRYSNTPMAASRSRALRLMRKLDGATGGKPQHWETLDSLGAV